MHKRHNKVKASKKLFTEKESPDTNIRYPITTAKEKKIDRRIQMNSVIVKVKFSKDNKKNVYVDRGMTITANIKESIGILSILKTHHSKLYH